MGNRRMMTKVVTDDGGFTELSASAQALYLHLTMSGDDDGFTNQVATCMFKAHASAQDLEALLERRFILQFSDGVIVIRHWRLANALRNDRYKPTTFKGDLERLTLQDGGVYEVNDSAEWLPNGCQMVAKRLPQLNITEQNITEQREERKEGRSDKSEHAPSKHKTKFGEFKNVSLTEEELDKLKTEHGSKETEEAITILDEYIETSGRKYKSCYLALKNWGFRAVQERNKTQKTKYDEVDEWLAAQNNSQ